MTEYPTGTIFKVVEEADPPYFPLGSVIVLITNAGSKDIPYEFYCEGIGYSYMYADDLSTLQRLDAKTLQEAMA